MSEHTNIVWAHHTFSPWLGCTKVGPPCDGCYAESWAKRAGHPDLWQGERRRTTASYWQQPIKWNRAAAAAGVRRRVFPSLCDPFDNQVPERWRHDFWHRIEQTPNLDWLLLTKRPQNIPKMLPNPETGVQPWGTGWPNVWFGVSASNQEEVNRNIPILLATPARIYFASLEPLLGPIDLTQIKLNSGMTFNALKGGEIASSSSVRYWRPLDLAIVGGESGSRARPMHHRWPRKIRDDCTNASVPFLFKQHGEWIGVPDLRCLLGYEGPGFGIFDHCPYDQHHEAVRIGKRAAGRLLDGRTWDEMPETERQVHRQAGSDPVADHLHQDASMRGTP
jgi:protein gp37